MKKLNVAIIGQGRSGKNIHGAYFRSEVNEHYNVKYVVDFDPFRREVAEKIYPGCVTFEDYRSLFDIKDIDLVVNATYSEMHYPVSLDLVEHGFNVLVEKPMGATEYECQKLIKTAEKMGVVLAVYHQSLFAPYYLKAKEIAESGKLGDIKQINIAFSGFSRRWDWQTLQKKCAGGLYNTGPHPVGMALGFLGFDKDTKVVYSKLGSALTSGDADDYAKVILEAPGKPVVDIEVSSCDAFSNFTLKVQGSRGTLKTSLSKCEIVYIVDGENPERPVIEASLKNEAGEPIYCGENLIKHTEEIEFKSDVFEAGAMTFYGELYHKISEGRPMSVTPEMAAAVVKVIAEVHAKNPMPVKFL
ncbi:MAG: Gfo/Idh/MocA family oxidoreductase [Clostridia bacterium]|nr:Gfo/Idh/MocA family oxidoreductase [Clostridia bacterium]